MRAFVLPLFVGLTLLFWACKPNTAVTPKSSGAGSAPSPIAADLPQNGSIVFVNIDSLMLQYNYYGDSKKRLEGRIESMGREMDAKTQALYKRAGELEAKVQEMTRQQLEAAQQSLSEEEGRVMKSRESMEKTFAKEQEALDAELKKKINTYFAELSEKNKYRYIMSYTSSGLGMLYGDPDLDITKLVVKELNERYLEENKK